MHCLLADKGTIEWLRKQGIDPAWLVRLLDQVCRREVAAGDATTRLKGLLGEEPAFAVVAEVLGRMETMHRQS